MTILLTILFVIALIIIYKLGMKAGEEAVIDAAKHWVITVLAKHIVLAEDMSSTELIDSICRDFGFNITKENQNE